MKETAPFPTTRVVNAGSVKVAVPKLLGLMRIPAGSLGLFLAGGILDPRFAALTSAAYVAATALT